MAASCRLRAPGQGRVVRCESDHTPSCRLEAIFDWAHLIFEVRPNVDLTRALALHSSLIIFVNRVGTELVLADNHTISGPLFIHLHLVRLHSEDACVITVEVSEQAAPVAPEVVLDSIVVLLEIPIECRLRHISKYISSCL